MEVFKYSFYAQAYVSRAADGSFPLRTCSMTRSATNQHDIARLLGVSQNTVSLALRGSERISADLRLKVTEAADRLGYSPSMAGLAMVTGSFSSLALVVGTDPDRSNLTLDLLRGMLDGSVARQRHLQVAKFSDLQYADEHDAPRLFRELSADGLLVNYHWGAPPALDRLIQRHRLPAVWLNALREHDCVRPDDHGAGARCVRELLAAGARKPAWIDFSMSQERMSRGQHYSFVDRAEGYRIAAEAAGIEPRIFRPPYDPPYRDYQKLADELVAAGPEIDGFAANGLDSAIALLLALRGQGRQPGPGTHFIICADRPAWSLTGGLPTLLVPHHAMGRRAVDLLLERIANPEERSPTEVLPFGFFAGGDDQSAGTDVSGARSF
jgi:LacI family transcriptional regulator